MLDVYEGSREPDDKYTEDSWAEYGLAFDYVEPETFRDQDEGYWRFQISYGGPSEEFRFYASPSSADYAILSESGMTFPQSFHLYRCEFWYLDWFDGAHCAGGDVGRRVWDWFSDVGAVANALAKAIRP